jgi:hypothetical protein
MGSIHDPPTAIVKTESFKKSALLLGPHHTGRSTLMLGITPDLGINLIHEPTFLDFASDPHEFEQRIQAIAPKLLLTGSSGRKLKRGRANLLPERGH